VKPRSYAIGQREGIVTFKVNVVQEDLARLPDHGQIPIAFEVRSILELAIADGGLGGFLLRERHLASPYVKDYDAVAADRPSVLSGRFNIENWILHSAWVEGRRVGGAVIAFKTDGLDMLEQREDLAMVWDLRVAPDVRGHGVGSALFSAAEAWSKARGCRQLKVETQSVNVAACRFYLRQGCTLGGIFRFAYPSLPDEVQLLWYKEL
jgi:GNAT superfamily N-acetyltransferase